MEKAPLPPGYGHDQENSQGKPVPGEPRKPASVPSRLEKMALGAGGIVGVVFTCVALGFVALLVFFFASRAVESEKRKARLAEALAADAAIVAGAPRVLTPIPEREYIARYTSSFCDNYEHCCASQGYGFEQDRCNSSGRVFLHRKLPKPGSDFVYDAQAAAECVDLRARSARSCRRKTISEDAIEEACRRVYRRRERSCEGPSGCAEGEVCAPARPGAQEKVCTANPRRALGEPCSRTCEDRGYEMSCQQPVAGASPDERGICVRSDGLGCDPEQGKCVALGERGQPCKSDPGCKGADVSCERGTCKESTDEFSVESCDL